jgi:hypothetical protein
MNFMVKQHELKLILLGVKGGELRNQGHHRQKLTFSKTHLP